MAAETKKRIGDILIEMGFIDQDQLAMALEETKKTGTLLGNVLIRLDWIDEEQLQMALAVQSGAKILDINSISVDSALTAEIPKKFVIDHGIFPFAKTGNTIKVATTNPFDVIAKDELARIAGYQVVTYIAPKQWIANAIERYYKTARTIDAMVESITRQDGSAPKGFEENQVVKLADLLIEKGHVLAASDIHLVADTHLARIYYRVDGVLHQQYLFPKIFHKSLVARFKIIGNMDISNPNTPHDGRIRHSGRFGEVDIRVSTFPTQLGETVVMRLLTHSKIVGDIKQIGFEKSDRDRFLKTVQRPYGLVLLTGPTGSGKTTTLYTALMTIHNPGLNAMTIEDPIEYVIPTIRQTAVNPKAGLNFSTALRAAMRQDPDIILVGEIRDQETAELALRASITGHLVLSTLHTNDAAAAVSRLLDLGVNSSMLASSLTAVVAQRLVRLVCPQCATRVAPSAEQKEVFVRNRLKPPAHMQKAVGCESCHHSGYKGRTGIQELLVVDRKLEELIFTRAPHGTIKDAAVASGTTPMLKQALKKIHYQVTTFEEIFRVIADA